MKTISGAFARRFFGAKTYAGRIIGLPAPCPVGFVFRSGLLVYEILSIDATSPILKYQRRSSVLFTTSSNARSVPRSCDASALAVAGGSGACAIAAVANRIVNRIAGALRMGGDVTLTENDTSRRDSLGDSSFLRACLRSRSRQSAGND